MIACFSKDFRLMKNQVKFFMMIVLISIFLMAGNKNPFFAVPYIVFICSFTAINAIGYDEVENGFSFLFTLPVSRKEYVIEKYIFSVLLTIMSAFVAFLLLLGYLVKENETGDTGEYLFMTISFLLVIVVYMAVMLPLIFKFGIEKGRVMIAAAMATIGGGVLIVIKTLPKYEDKMGVILDTIGQIGKIPLLGLGAAGCVVIMGLSCLFSIRIMEKKEF